MSQELPPVPGILDRTSKEGKISYVLGKRMGSGGFATVYACEEMPGHHPIAVKCIPKTRLSDPKVKEKLISEVEIHRRLHHKNVVEFKAVFQDQNYVYILLELCRNGTVLDQLRKKKRFSEEEVVHIIKQLLEGLVYLHENKVIHRDLKLQNFLLDDDMTLKIADFGLSAKLQDDDEKRMTVCGTPGYLSPEVLDRHEGQTYSVDIWATGVCAFLMLTGKQPFQSKDKKATYRNIQRASYTWPSEPEVSEVARNFVDSALQIDPSVRPTARGLLQHPFILGRSSPVVLPHQPQELSLPSYAVRIWWDYSHKYGLAYLLRNHVCGARFNDTSRLLITPNEDLAQYWENRKTVQPVVISMRSIESSPIKKKLLLIKHFAKELKKRSQTMTSEPLRINMPTDEISHVKYWVRTKEGVLFRMANRNMQANFVDHTKLIIETEAKQLYYENSERVIQVAWADISDPHKFPEVRKKVAVVKQMAKSLT